MNSETPRRLSLLGLFTCPLLSFLPPVSPRAGHSSPTSGPHRLLRKALSFFGSCSRTAPSASSAVGLSARARAASPRHRGTPSRDRIWELDGLLGALCPGRFPPRSVSGRDGKATGRLRAPDAETAVMGARPAPPRASPAAATPRTASRPHCPLVVSPVLAAPPPHAPSAHAAAPPAAPTPNRTRFRPGPGPDPWPHSAASRGAPPFSA